MTITRSSLTETDTETYSLESLPDVSDNQYLTVTDSIGEGKNVNCGFEKPSFAEYFLRCLKRLAVKNIFKWFVAQSVRMFVYVFCENLL